MAAVSWANPGTSGNWNDSANWSPAAVPAAGDDVTLGDGAGPYTVTLDVSSENLDSLTLGSTTGGVTLAVGSNTLTVLGIGGGATDTITLQGTANSEITLAAGTIAATSLAIATGSTLFGFGGVNAAVSGSGTVVASGGMLELAQSLATTNGAFDIASSSELQLDGSPGSTNTFSFINNSGNTGELGLGNDIGIGGDTISGMVVGATPTDVIDIEGHTVTISSGASGTGTTGTLILSDGETLNLSGITGADAWMATTTPDVGSGTFIYLTPCYCRGTRILTDRGEIAVEELAIGDRVMTLSGEAKPIKWIGRRGYAGQFIAGNRAVLPVRIAEGAVADGVPARDLWVSPEHALYLDGALVPAGLLVNGASIVQAEEVEQVEYFHIELSEHDVIFADGAPAESFIDDDSRGVFHNAAEFYARYPDTPVRQPAVYCAPRLEEGVALEALRRRLLGRARRLGADGTAPPGVLSGYLELVHHARIAGWALDPASPDTPVALVVLADGAEIGRVVADRYGHHAFELVVPGGLAAGVRHEIEVRREADWSLLLGSPAVLEPVAAGRPHKQLHPPAAASPPLGALRGKLDTCDRTRIAGWVQDSADPERRVGLLVTVNDQVIGRVLANGYRRDLETAGIGDGRHAFELTVPPAVPGLAVLEAWRIRVEREADGVELPGSPLTLPAANGFDAATKEAFAGILAGAATGAAEDRALAFLTEQADRLLARRAERHGRHAEREAHRLFRRRWGPRGENGQEANGSEPSRPPHLRALVVDRQVPCAERDAGSVAILSHVRALRGLGYEVSFAASDEMGDASALARLAEAEGIATCGGPHYSCVEDVLCRQAGSFDLVYLHRVENADRYLPLVRRYCPKARILYSVADLHHLRLARQAKIEGRPELLAHSRYLAAIEMMAARRADLVITHSPVEAELLRREVGFGKVHVVPFAVPSRQPRRPFAERRGVAFLGSFGHAPNPDAVHYLAREIMPRVWARDPRLTCKIVGHGWHADRLPRLDPRIEMIGEVADLGAVFDTVRLTVAPLRFGAGIKGKVLDSFAAGLPCVMTPIAAEGLALTGALAQLVAADPAGLAELILHHHADPAANDQAGRDGARMVASEFTNEHVSDALREVLQLTPGNPVINKNPSSNSAMSDNMKMTSIA